MDYSVLLKECNETQSELNEAENRYRRIMHPWDSSDDSNINIRYVKDSRSWSFIPSKSFAYKKPFKFHKSSGMSKEIAREDHFLYHRGTSSFEESSGSAEETAYEDELQRKKVCLKSAVIARVRKSESRKDVICRQNVDKKVQNRNCRILGMLQSTLRKFQDDAVKRQPQDLKRKMMEQKVEAAKEEEKWRMKREETELYRKIKEKKLKLNILKEMIEITERYGTWKDNKIKLLSFITTKAEPRICYLPVSHTRNSLKRLDESQTEIQENVLKQAAAVKEELAEIQDPYLALQQIPLWMKM